MPSKKNDRVKMAVIPVLLIVFVVVLLPGGEAKSDKAVPAFPPPQIKNTAEQRVAKRRNVEWPTYSLTNITSHNPFELLDPRAILDAELLAYGIIGPESMTEVRLEEFLGTPQSIDTDTEAEAFFLAELMDWPSALNQAGEHQALAENSSAAERATPAAG